MIKNCEKKASHCFGYPMKLKAAYKDYIWGGSRLKKEFGKVTDLHPIAESWEVSCHPDGASEVLNGEFAGKTLLDVLSSNPELIGTKCKDKTQFPVLIKLIDAENDLSLQVHPDNEYAARVENQQGKNEMWYIVDSKPGAQIILGFSGVKQFTKTELLSVIENGTIIDFVHSIPVKAGECYCIPAGIIHAIGRGVLIAEVQQNSNLTYRVYDYGRLDAGGNPRELHIEKAADVIDVPLKPVKSNYGKRNTPDFKMEQLSDWAYFDARKYDLQGKMEMDADTQSFHTYLCLDGEAVISYGSEAHDDDRSMKLIKGESVYIPAGMGKYVIKGKAELLFVSL